MDAKTRGIVAYLTFIGLIIAIVTNDPKEELASFHIRQMLGLTIFSFAGLFVSAIPIIGWLLSPLVFIFLFVLWVIGLLGALNGELKLVPLFGDKYQEWFKTL